MPKKIRILGLKSALSLKAKNGNLNILENIKFENKTNLFKKSLDKLKLKNLLLVVATDESNLGLVKIINNIPNVDLIKQIGLNVLDIIKKDKLLFTEKALREIEERL